MIQKGFTLVEMLMALLIVSLILSASLPAITQRTKEQAINCSKHNAVPVGMIAIWGSEKSLPDNTWLECNGQAIPNGIEFEKIRQIYGTNLPDYRGVFLRGYGSITHTKNNGSISGNTPTTHSSGKIGVTQGDAIRKIWGHIAGYSASTYPSGLFKDARGSFYTSELVQGGPLRDANIQRSPVLYFDSSLTTPSDNEIRPVNKAVRFIIKVKN